MRLPWADKNRHTSNAPRIPIHQRSDYKEYMLSAYWKEKRELCMERDGGRCQDCGAMATEVHHKTYDRLFNEDLEDLVALCSECHRARHGRQRMPKLPVRRSGKKWRGKSRFQNLKRRKKRSGRKNTHRRSIKRIM